MATLSEWSKSGKLDNSAERKKATSGQVLQRAADGSRVSSGASALQAQYNKLLKERQKEQEQQQQQQQQQQEQAPDTTGWAQATDTEKFLHGMGDVGKAVADPFSFGETWSKVKSGEADAGDYASLIPRAAGQLIGGIPGAALMTPELLYEAATGTNTQDMYGGMVSNEKLSDEQRGANLVNAGVNVISLVPGVGVEGTVAKGVLGLGKNAVTGNVARQAARNTAAGQAARTSAREAGEAAQRTALQAEGRRTTGEAAEQAVRESGERAVSNLPEDAAWRQSRGMDNWNTTNASLGEKIGSHIAASRAKRQAAAEGIRSAQRAAWSSGDKATSRKIFRAGAAGTAAQEVLEEGIQTGAEVVRGAGSDDSGVHLLFDENAADSWGRIAEGAALGGLLGGGFHAINTGVQYASYKLGEEVQKIADQQAQYIENISKGSKESSDQLSGSFSPQETTEYIESSTDKDEMTTKVVNQGLEEESAKKKRRASRGFSGIAVGKWRGAKGNKASMTIDNLVEMYRKSGSDETEEGVRSQFLDTLFGSHNEQSPIDLSAEQDAFAHAAETGDYDTALAAVNSAAQKKAANNDPVMLLLYKSPANNFGPYKVRVDEFMPGSNMVAVDPVGVSLLGSDYDGDLLQTFLHTQDELESTSWLEDILLDYKGESTTDWRSANMDISNFNKNQIDDLCEAIGNELGVEHFGASPIRPYDSHGVEATSTVAREMDRIAGISDDDARHAAMSQLMATMKLSMGEGGLGFDSLSDVWHGWSYGVAMNGMFINTVRSKNAKPVSLRTVEEILEENRIVEEEREKSEQHRERQQLLREEKETQREAEQDIVKSQGKRPHVIQSGRYKPSVFGQLADLAIDMITFTSHEKGAANALFRMANGAYYWFHSHEEEDGTFYISDGGVNIQDPFTFVVQSNMDKEFDGETGKSYLAQILRYELRKTLAEKMDSKGELRINDDFKIDDVFDDEVIDRLNETIGAYNNALKQFYVGSETLEAPADTFLLQDVSRNGGHGKQSIYDVFILAAGDDVSLRDLFANMRGSNAEILNENGDLRSMTLGDWLDDQLGAEWPKRTVFDDIVTGEKQDVNEDIGKFLRNLKSANERRIGRNEATAQKIFAGEAVAEDLNGRPQNIADASDVEAFRHGNGLDNGSDAFVEFALDSAHQKGFLALHRLLGWRNVVRLGLESWGRFKRDADAMTWLDPRATRDQRQNAAWNLLMRANLNTLVPTLIQFSNTDLSRDERLTHAAMAIRWCNNAVDSGNFLFGCIANAIQQQMYRAGVLADVDGDGVVRLDVDCSDEKLNTAAADVAELVNGFISREVSFATKIDALDKAVAADESTLASRTGEPRIEAKGSNMEVNGSVIPWCTYAMAGWTSNIRDIGVPKLYKQMKNETGSFVTQKASRIVSDLNDVEKQYLGTNHDDKSRTTLMNALLFAADESNVASDSSILTTEEAGVFLSNKEALEKTGSPEHTARSVAAHRLLMGLPFRTLLNMNTSEISNSLSAKEFGSCRKAILWTLLGKIDPETSRPYQVYVYSPDGDGWELVTQRSLLGLPEGSASATVEQIMAFLKQNPNIASWLYPVRIQSSSTLTGPTAGYYAKNTPLAGYINQISNWMNNPSDPECCPKWARRNGQPVPIEQYQTEQRVLREFHNDMAYKQMLAMMLPDIDSANLSSAETHNMISSKMKELDEYVINQLGHYIMRVKDSSDPDAGADVTDRIARLMIQDMQNDLDRMFQDTTTERLGMEYINSAIDTITRTVDEACSAEMLTQMILIEARNENIDLEVVENLSTQLAEQMSEQLTGSVQAVSDSMVMRLLASSMLLDTNLAFVSDTLERILTTGSGRLRFEDIAENFPEDQQAVALQLYNNVLSGDFKNIVDQVAGNFMFTTEACDGWYAIDETTGEIKATRESIVQSVAEWFENHETASNDGWAYTEFAESVMTDEMFDTDGNFIDEYTAQLVSAVNRKVASQYFQHESQKHTFHFDSQTDPLTTVALVQNAIPRLYSNIRCKYGEDYLRDWVPPQEDVKPPKFYPFTAANNLASSFLRDWNLSAEAKLQIGLEGAAGKLCVSFGFLSEFECEGAQETIGIADFATRIADIDGQRLASDSAEENLELDYKAHDGETYRSREVFLRFNGNEGLAEAVVGNRNATECRLTRHNIDAIRDWIADSHPDSDTQLTLKYADIPQECTCGCCRVHNPNFLPFMRMLLSTAQEGRAMKMKKKFREVEKILKGNLNKRDSLLEAETFTNDGSLDANRVYLAWRHFTANYADCIRDHSLSSNLGETALEDIDEKLWYDQAPWFAQTMVPCVTIRLNDGSSFSVGITELRNGNVRNVVESNRAGTDVDLDWGDVASVDMRIMSIDEFNAHILNRMQHVNGQSIDENGNSTDVDWSTEANNAMNDWSRYNYCDASVAGSKRFGIDRIIANVGMLSNSVYEPMTLTVNPTALEQYRNKNNLSMRREIEPPSASPRYMSNEDNAPDLDEFRREAVCVGDVPIACYITDRTRSNSDASQFVYLKNRAGGTDTYLDAANKRTGSWAKDGFYDKTAVLVDFDDYNDPAVKQRLRKVVEVATSHGTVIVFDVTNGTPPGDIFGLFGDVGSLGQRVELLEGGVGVDTRRSYMMFNTRNMARVQRSDPNPDVQMDIEYVTDGEGWYQINGYAPWMSSQTTDGSGVVPANSLRKLRTVKHDVFSKKMDAYKNAEDVNLYYGLSAEHAAITEDIDHALSAYEYGRAERAAGRMDSLLDVRKDIGAEERNWDLQDIPAGMTYSDAIKAIRTYVDKVAQGEFTVNAMGKVKQGDVVAVTSKTVRDEHGRLAQRWVPVFFDGPMPTNECLVEIADVPIKGDSFMLRYHYDDSMSSIYKTVKLFGVEGLKMQMQASLDEITCDWTDGLGRGRVLDVDAMSDFNSTNDRRPIENARRSAKLTIFVVAHDKFCNNVFEGIAIENVDGYFENLGGFSKQDVVNFLSHMSPWNKPTRVERSFWIAVANGNIRLRKTFGSEELLDIKQQRSMGRLIISCLAQNTNPMYLFAPAHEGMTQLRLQSKLNQCILAENAGVSLDAVMAYANWQSAFGGGKPLCSPTPQVMSEEDFMASDYLIDKDCRMKCNWVKKDDVHRNQPGYNQASNEWFYAMAIPFSGGGDSNLRSISCEAGVSDQAELMRFLARGVRGGNVRGVLRAVQNATARYNEDMYNSAYERILLKDQKRTLSAAENGDGSWTYGDMRESEDNYASINVTIDPVSQYNSGRKFNEMVGKRLDFYMDPMKNVRVKHPTENNELVGQDWWDDHLARINECDRIVASNGHIHEDLLLRLVMMRVGWNPTSDGENDMSAKLFESAFEELIDIFNTPGATVFDPPRDGKRYVYNGKTREFFGVMEPYWLNRLYQACPDPSTIAMYRQRQDGELWKRMRQNLNDAEESASGVADRATKRVALADVAYFKYLLDGEKDYFALYGERVSIGETVSTAERIAGSMLPGNVVDRARLREYAKVSHNLAQQRLKAEEERNTRRSGQMSRNGIVASEERHASDHALNSMAEGIVKLNQATTMLSMQIPVANIVATGKGAMIQGIGLRLAEHGFGAYAHSMDTAMDVSSDVIDVATSDGDAQLIIEAMETAKFEGDPHDLENTLANGGSVREYLDRTSRPFKGILRKGTTEGETRNFSRRLYGAIMKFGGGAKFWKKRQLKNFLNHFRRYMGKYGLQAYGPQFERDLAIDPAGTILGLFKSGSVTEQAARAALNQTMLAADGADIMPGWFLNRVAKNRGTLKLLGSTVGGMPFFNSFVNITYRTMKNFIPGVSMVNYLLVDYMQTHADDVFTENSALGRAVHRMSQVDMETLKGEFLADADALKLAFDLREAILIDMQHLSIPALGFVLMFTGALRAPEDDDKYDDWQEWTIFGCRVELAWWVKDLIGPVIPWACYFQSLRDDGPSHRMLMNSLGDFMSTSPFVNSESLLQLITDPSGSIIEGYEECKEWYADSQQGEPELQDYIMASGGAAALSCLANIITPKFLKELAQYSSDTEKSYNKVYKTDSFGNRIWNEDYGAYETTATDYGDAQLRKICRYNPLLATMMDFISGYQGEDAKRGTGYQWNEMPDQTQYDANQIECMRMLSVYDYDTGEVKNDDEIAATCLAIVSILDSSTDMSQLYSEGFYLDKATKKAVAEYIWDLYAEENERWSKLQQSGKLDFYKLGDGDYSTGREKYYKLQAKHYKVLSYYKDTLYYGKLTSDELNQGLVKYTRYNTTYRTDANGDIYASGVRQGGDLWSAIQPVYAAPVSEETTAGAGGDWATRSVVTGTGMYDDNDNPLRALMPEATAGWPEEITWDGLDNGSGYSNGYSAWGDDSGATYYYGGGYGGYGGYGGGGSYYSHTYASTFNGMGNIYTKTPSAATTRNRTYAHSINFNRLNIASPMTYTHLYTENPMDIRPDFETKGSRQAYRRTDF